jgi:hypothetical protein
MKAHHDEVHDEVNGEGDAEGCTFTGLVNVIDLKAGGLGNIGDEQLAWLANDLQDRSASTPIVVFAHIPLWAVYPQWGWGTDDGARALDTLKSFGSVTATAISIRSCRRSKATSPSTLRVRPPSGREAPSGGPARSILAFIALDGVGQRGQLSGQFKQHDPRIQISRFLGLSDELGGLRPVFVDARHRSPPLQWSISKGQSVYESQKTVVAAACECAVDEAIFTAPLLRSEAHRPRSSRNRSAGAAAAIARMWVRTTPVH